jgi:hypothetical protein
MPPVQLPGDENPKPRATAAPTSGIAAPSDRVSEAAQRDTSDRSRGRAQDLLWVWKLHGQSFERDRCVVETESSLRDGPSGERMT